MTQRLLFSAMKNEGPFLLEWVAYHRAIGFDRIVVVSNDCEDGTDLLLDALSGAGAVEHWRQTPAPGIAAQQGAAILAAENGLPAAGDWAIWLDADEFLNIHAGEGRVDDLIGAVGSARGMLIPWRVFGDGGNSAFPGRHISGDFTRAAPAGSEANLEIKTFFRAGDDLLGFAQRGINRPLIAAGSKLAAKDFVSARGQVLDADSPATGKWLAGKDRGGSFQPQPSELGWDLAQINHYAVRTPEFFALKRKRGRGWVSAEVNRRHTDDYYRKMNRNDDLDTSILRHQSGVDAEITRLLDHPTVADAVAQVAARTAIMLQGLADADPAPPPEAADSLTPAILSSEPPVPEAPILTLPKAEAALLREVYAGASSVLEYGSGGSTLVAADCGAEVFSVESSAEWAGMMQAYFAAHGSPERIRIHYADIGPTKAWGRPKRAGAVDKWPGYALSVWERPDFVAPDVVLIDGRFRLACFLTTAILTKRDVTVLWDDYIDRPSYHQVEKLVRPVSMTGRMARFELTPKPFPPEHLGMLAQSYVDFE